jgi:ADP-ribose pyrophosphatase
MASDLHEEMLDSVQVFDGRLLKVFSDRVRLPDGAEGVREYIRHPGAVVVIAVTAEGKLLFERQHRYPLHRDMLELPAGKIDPLEPIEACARRELREETGFDAGEWRHLGVMHPCIGYSDERIEIFLARGLTPGSQSLDPHEFLEVLEIGLEEAVEAVFDGRITDAKTITALLWAQRVLG